MHRDFRDTNEMFWRLSEKSKCAISLLTTILTLEKVQEALREIFDPEALHYYIFES